MSVPQIPNPQSQIRGRRPPQFGLKMMFLVMTVVALALGGASGMLRGGEDLAFFVLLTAAAPLLAVLVLGAAQQIAKYRRRKR
jgi:hypothetical protein